jgi:hypothetical protein
MLGLLARISSSSGFILATTVAISSLSLAACALAQFGLLEHRSQKHLQITLKRENTIGS